MYLVNGQSKPTCPGQSGLHLFTASSALSHGQRCPGLDNISYGPFSLIHGLYLEKYHCNSLPLSSSFIFANRTFPRKVSSMFLATENPNYLIFPLTDHKNFRILCPFPATCKGGWSCIEFQKLLPSEFQKAKLTGERGGLLTRAQEKTTLKHNE